MTRIKQDMGTRGDLVAISNAGGEDTFLSIRLDATNNTLLFSYKTNNNNINTLSFSHPEVSLSDGEWHKLVLVIDTNSILLYLDCTLIGRRSMEPPLLRNFTDFSDYGLTLGDSRALQSQLFHVSSAAC